MNNWYPLIEAGRRSHQVVTLSHAVACGLDPKTLRRRAHVERWEQLHPGVFALPGSSATHQRRVSAALLAMGGKVAACRWTAASLWGMTDQVPELVDVVIPPARRAPRLAGVQALRSGTVVGADLGEVEGLAVTTPPRTICDLAAVIRDDDELRALVVTALQRRILDPVALRARHGGLRRSPGAARLGRVLRHLGLAPAPDLAHEIRTFLRARCVTPYPQPLWVTCQDGQSRKIAIPFIEFRVGIQPTGGRSDQDDDDDLQLAATGWRIARITHQRFLDDRERWLDGLLRLLRMPPPKT